jgi:membrane protease YdiL (CAAX protease family)
MNPAHDRAAVAPAVAAALVLAVAPLGMLSTMSVWLLALVLGVWAVWYFRKGRLADGAIIVAAATVLAMYASASGFIGFYLMPFPVLVPIFIFTYWRARPEPPLPWLRLGFFGWSGALAALVVAIAGGAVAWGVAAWIPPNGSWWASSWFGIGSKPNPWPDLPVSNMVTNALIVGMVWGAAEEALFRGALQERLTSALGPLLAVAVQAFAYSAYSFMGTVATSSGHLHGGLRLGAGVAVGLVLGLLLGVLRRLSDGLFAPWAAHTCANMAILLAVQQAAR